MSKKKTSKKTAEVKAETQRKAFFDAVHPVLTGGFPEPAASEHTRAAYRQFVKNLTE